MVSIIDRINSLEEWQTFLNFKISSKSLSISEEKELVKFIDNKRYEYYYDLIKDNNFPSDFPYKKIINKSGTDKKRIVYSFSNEENIVLKFIAFNLYQFDYYFNNNCYAFRRNYGVKDAIRKFKGNEEYAKKYCFKVDISNYFNSIDIDILLKKLVFVREQDEELFRLFEKILREDRVYENGNIVSDSHGAMAGMPCSPFFANVYLSDVDKYFEEYGVEYFRYSDDVLIFADEKEDIEKIRDIFSIKVKENKLELNERKVSLYKPYESFEFLGFSYNNGIIDISDNTKRKLKAKIKRKANALRRWQRKKNLSSDKAAIGFIKAMNCKFYGGNNEDNQEDFTWCRWFFPNIMIDTSLIEIDKYMQEYIRYIITGRHYKGNYRITYEQMKEWGYRSLVHEYYAKDRKIEIF